MISNQVEELIIQNYIHGHPRDEIAEETGVAPGTVSNKINEWKRKLEAPGIEELRRFAVNMNKSGMTIKQCTKGFRFLQILKGLGIAIENDDIDSDLNSLFYFVNEIYKKCEEVGITPNVVTAWIDDLLYFSTENYGYLYESSKNHTERPSNENQNSEKRALTFVSVVSDFVEQKKRKLGDLSEQEKKIRKEIKVYELQKTDLIGKIKILEQQRQSIIGLHNTFMKLDKILRDDCGIDIKKDLGPITKLFIDFKENGYNVTNIVTEYNKAVKLRWDIAQNEKQIEAYQKKLTDLSNEIHACQSILNINRKLGYLSKIRVNEIWNRRT